MILYVLHDENDEALVGHPAGYRKDRRGAKKQPKAYTTKRNAQIAISNMHGRGQIVPYVAINDTALLKHIATAINKVSVSHISEEDVLWLLDKFVKERESNE